MSEASPLGFLLGPPLARRPEGEASAYVRWLERKVAALAELGLSDCGGDFFAGETPRRLPERFQAHEPELPHLGPQPRRGDPADFTTREQEGRMAYEPIDCADCGKTFQRTGPSQGRRSTCYDCLPRGARPKKRRRLGCEEAAARFRRLRAQAGLSKRELGEELGVTAGAIYTYEHARTPIPESAWRVLARLVEQAGEEEETEEEEGAEPEVEEEEPEAGEPEAPEVEQPAEPPAQPAAEEAPAEPAAEEAPAGRPEVAELRESLRGVARSARMSAARFLRGLAGRLEAPRG